MVDAGRQDHFSLGKVESSTPEQLSLNLPKAKSKGVSFLQGGATRYAAREGLSYSHEGLADIQADPVFQHRVAAKYDAVADSDSHHVKRAYTAMTHEVHKQFDYLTRPRHEGGLGVNVSFQDKDPYKTHDEMFHDVKHNKSLKVLSSAATGGAPHEHLDADTNDKFRAVHDAFGHAAVGRGFSRHGEEAAYHSHMQMFSPTARPAMANETRAQNSWLNYRGGTFPKQKAAVMPDWATKSRVRVSPTTER